MIEGCRLALSPDLQRHLDTVLDDWREAGKVRRLWARDASLWTGTNEHEWLGWLDVPREQLANLDQLRSFADEIKAERFAHVLLLGMGGSSLCPEVLRMTFGTVDGHPELHVLDSTDPAQVTSFERKIDPAETLFIVASKSGTTLEPNILKEYFFERIKEALGPDVAGDRCIAITDPGSKLQSAAEADGFRHIFFGEPTIGGRYSALSNFGMVPAAAMGLDIARLLKSAQAMAAACAAAVPLESNPGLVLGATLGALGRLRRDKVTLIITPALGDLGVWLEQLVAESTGKDGVALIPIDGESLGSPQVYGKDRLFVYLRLESEPDPDQDERVAELEQSGHPVVRLSIADRYDLGAEFFRWEFATAVAGSILGINPFTQSDVEASKIATRELTGEYEATGALPVEQPIVEGDGLKLFADEHNAAALAGIAGGVSVAHILAAHLGRLRENDYFALLAYIEMNSEHRAALQAIRHAVRDARNVATALEFGPRFLHSTGQAYKGGPNTGVFLQITCDDAADLAVPGRKYTFGVVKAAQARGDLEVLGARGRRALRIHLGIDVAAGLETLQELIGRALI